MNYNEYKVLVVFFYYFFLMPPIFPDCHTKPSKLSCHAYVAVSETEMRYQLVYKPLALSVCILPGKYFSSSKQLFKPCVPKILARARKHSRDCVLRQQL